jgi:SpoVK/Ycf46/Vps4 family AAA+-type ATPase
LTVKNELKIITNRLLQSEKIFKKSGRLKKAERSIRVLFDGPTATGKTLAAEHLSKSIGLRLSQEISFYNFLPLTLINAKNNAACNI